MEKANLTVFRKRSFKKWKVYLMVKLRKKKHCPQKKYTEPVDLIFALQQKIPEKMQK